MGILNQLLSFNNNNDVVLSGLKTATTTTGLPEEIFLLQKQQKKQLVVLSSHFLNAQQEDYNYNINNYGQQNVDNKISLTTRIADYIQKLQQQQLQKNKLKLLNKKQQQQQLVGGSDKNKLVVILSSFVSVPHREDPTTTTTGLNNMSNIAGFIKNYIFTNFINNNNKKTTGFFENEPNPIEAGIAKIELGAPPGYAIHTPNLYPLKACDPSGNIPTAQVYFFF